MDGSEQPDNQPITEKRNPAEHLAPFKFAKGKSGNPGGRPKDRAAEVARAIFERDPEGIAKAFDKSLKRGNPKTFAALADRGYGKLPQTLTGNDGGPLEIKLSVIHIGGTPKSE